MPSSGITEVVALHRRASQTGVRLGGAVLVSFTNVPQKVTLPPTLMEADRRVPDVDSALGTRLRGWKEGAQGYPFFLIYFFPGATKMTFSWFPFTATKTRGALKTRHSSWVFVHGCRPQVKDVQIIRDARTGKSKARAMSNKTSGAEFGRFFFCRVLDHLLSHSHTVDVLFGCFFLWNPIRGGGLQRCPALRFCGCPTGAGYDQGHDLQVPKEGKSSWRPMALSARVQFVRIGRICGPR